MRPAYAIHVLAADHCEQYFAMIGIREVIPQHTVPRKVCLMDGTEWQQFGNGPYQCVGGNFREFFPPGRKRTRTKKITKPPAE